MDLFLIFGPAIFICLLLTGIHCYLGLHVLARNIIFIDLALAQSAAFGLALCFLIGWEPSSFKSYCLVLASSLMASVLFTIISSLKNKISQEAFIGIVYAFFSVLVILLFDKTAHGSEHIKQTLTGHLIWASWSEVLKVFLIYSVTSIIYFIFHKQLWKSSIGDSTNWIWNFIFYSLFSVVISSSVSIAGVLLVFSFLIVPAFLSHFLFSKLFHRLIFGWGLSFSLSAVGLGLSYTLNLPTTPFIIFLFTSFSIIFVIGFLKKLKKSTPLQ